MRGRQEIENHPIVSEVSEFAGKVQGMSRGKVYVRKGCKLWLSSDELVLVFTILRKSTRLLTMKLTSVMSTGL